MIFSKLFQNLANTKTRTMVLFAGALIIVGALVIGTQLGQTNSVIGSEAHTLPVPSNIKAVPGNATPSQYQKLLQEDNQQRAEAARKNKASSIATLVGAQRVDAAEEAINADGTPAKTDAEGYLLDENGNRILDASGQPLKPTPKDIAPLLPPKKSGTFLGKSLFPGAPSAEKPQQQLDFQNEQIKMQQQRIEQLKAQQRADEERKRVERQQIEDQKTYQQSIEKINKAMESQAKAIFNKWGEVTPQVYATGGLAPTLEEAKQGLLAARTGNTGSSLASANNTHAPDPNNPQNTAEIIKAGSVLFGVLETAINSDEPSPVMASIVQGPYTGAKLIGSITTAPNGEKVIINFATLSIPSLKNSVSVSIVAIDPDTARTAVASDVDNHYLLRYGSLFASAFMDGYGSAITNAGSVTTTNAGANTSTVATPNLTGKQEVLAALGTVGQKWGKQAAPTFSIPPTITVDAGVGVGLLVLTDISIPKT